MGSKRAPHCDSPFSSPSSSRSSSSRFKSPLRSVMRFVGRLVAILDSWQAVPPVSLCNLLAAPHSVPIPLPAVRSRGQTQIEEN